MKQHCVILGSPKWMLTVSGNGAWSISKVITKNGSFMCDFHPLVRNHDSWVPIWLCVSIRIQPDPSRNSMILWSENKQLPKFQGASFSDMNTENDGTILPCPQRLPSDLCGFVLARERACGSQGTQRVLCKGFVFCCFYAAQLLGNLGFFLQFTITSETCPFVDDLPMTHSCFSITTLNQETGKRNLLRLTTTETFIRTKHVSNSPCWV